MFLQAKPHFILKNLFFDVFFFEAELWTKDIVLKLEWLNAGDVNLRAALEMFISFNHSKTHWC